MAYQYEINQAIVEAGEPIRIAILEAVTGNQTLPDRKTTRSFYLQVEGIQDPVKVDVSVG